MLPRADAPPSAALRTYRPRITNRSLALVLIVGLAQGDALPALAAPPANDLCVDASSIAGIGTFAFVNATALQDGPEHIGCSFFQQAQIDHDVWFAWTAPPEPCPNGFVVDTCGQTTVDTKIAVYSGLSCPPGSPLGCGDDSCGPDPFRQTRVLFQAQPGEAMLIRVGTFPGEQGGSGTFTVSCLAPPANDLCAAAIPITDEGFFPFDNTLASTDGPQHARCADGRQLDTGHDVWFCWTSPCDGRVFISTANQTNVDTKLFVYEGCGCSSGDTEMVACSDDYDPNVAGNRASHTAFDASLNQRYLIRIGTFAGAAGGVGTFSLSCGLEQCPSGGGCSSSHFNGGCDDADCCERVCIVDPFCCNGQWDSRCARRATGICNGNYNTCLPTAGLCTTNHTGPGCSDNTCCNRVCEVDPFCCVVKWDQFCVEKAAGLCNPSGFPSCQESAPDCDDPFRPSTPGCNDVDCCNSVCQTDTTCCVPSGGWDRVCEVEAAGSCHLACGAGAGDCLAAHSGSGCLDDTCCSAVCADDPFCCLFDWDSACVSRAVIACSHQVDCNGNGVPDPDDLVQGTSFDCDQNDIPDECDIAGGSALDCDANQVPDGCEIASGSAPDCNLNARPDSCDIADGSAQDCNHNDVPDSCDIANGSVLDCNHNTRPDPCDLADGSAPDCNHNDVPDSCDIADGTSLDSDADGTPNECVPAIPTVSGWGLLILALLIPTVWKSRSRPNPIR